MIQIIKNPNSHEIKTNQTKPVVRIHKPNAKAFKRKKENADLSSRTWINGTKPAVRNKPCHQTKPPCQHAPPRIKKTIRKRNFIIQPQHLVPPRSFIKKPRLTKPNNQENPKTKGQNPVYPQNK